MEETGIGKIQDTIQSFAWMNRGKPRKWSVRTVSLLAKI
jgi:hypothetical protein